MSLTLLQLVDQVCGELSLTQPAVVIGSGNNQVKQFLALIQRLGKDLVREFEWNRLVKIKQFQTTAEISRTGDLTAGSAVVTTLSTTADLSVGMIVSGPAIPSYAEIASIDSSSQITLNVAATDLGSVALLFKTQDYSLPSDFDRMIADTTWNRTNFWKARGSRTSQVWQGLQGGIVMSLWPDQYRLIGNKLRLHTAPSTSYHFAYEYVSNFWVMATGSTTPTKSLFSVDTDTCVFPDDLMQAGLKYYFLKAKKLDFAIEMAEYAEILSVRKNQDVPVGKTSMAPNSTDWLMVNTPEGNWEL